MNLRINVLIYNPKDQGRLYVEETLHFSDDLGFLEICRILGQFHELSKTLRRELPQNDPMTE